MIAPAQSRLRARAGYGPAPSKGLITGRLQAKAAAVRRLKQRDAGRRNGVRASPASKRSPQLARILAMSPWAWRRWEASAVSATGRILFLADRADEDEEPQIRGCWPGCQHDRQRSSWSANHREADQGNLGPQGTLLACVPTASRRSSRRAGSGTAPSWLDLHRKATETTCCRQGGISPPCENILVNRGRREPAPVR